jgi:class 3 adenylate cyclase/TolB-like protein/Tfp pilus assembly protein PilF
LEHGRKIATILAADVVGYSRLMGVDDAGTLASLRVLRALFEHTATEFEGREFGSVGDSLMAQFPSAVNAVGCALAIQEAVARESASLPPEQRMRLRIGINLGDVIEADGALFGDGVNVAARLQSLAPPGGILISGAVFEQVRKKFPARLEFAGDRHVKNIPDAIATYAVLQEKVRWPRLHALLQRPRLRVAAAAIVFALAVGAVAWYWKDTLDPLLPRSPSSTVAPAIAVLPFLDLTDNQSNAPFCDGLTEELLNSLAQLPNLRVVARTSAFMFRDPERDVRDIGRQLRVTHVLLGSVRRSGERVRITAQLANTRTGYNDWSDRFEAPFTDSLDIQQEIAQAVIRAMQVRLTAEDELRLTQPRARNVAAYESYLMGRYHQYQRTPEALEKAIAYQREATARDPQFALAYAGLADAHMAEFYYANRPIDDVAASVLPAVQRALELNPHLPEAYAARGTLRIEQSRLDEAQADLTRTITLNPNSAEGYVRLGAAMEYAGRPREALLNLGHAVELDPLHFILHIRTCLVHQNLGQYADAERACARAIELRPDLPNGHWGRALVASAHGDLPGAIASYRAALAQSPQRIDLLAELAWVQLDLGLLEPARQDLEQAIRISPPDQPYARVQKYFWYVAAGEGGALARAVSTDVAEAGGDTDLALDLALLSLVSGDLQRAQRFAKLGYDLAAATPQVLRNPYRVRWGHSSQLTLALVALRGGDTAGAAQRLAAFMDHLDELEHAGNVLHGLEYLRASVHALRQDSTAAMAALERAYQLGWRRAWWMRTDPAFAGVRNDPAFLDLVRRIEAGNAAALKAAGGQENVAVRPPIPNAP